MLEGIQIVGAVFVLIAYVGAQARLLDQDTYLYLVLNVVGSGLLALLAFDGREWGFLLLEGSWAVVTGLGLVRRAFRGGDVAAPGLPEWPSASVPTGWPSPSLPSGWPPVARQDGWNQQMAPTEWNAPR